MSRGHIGIEMLILMLMFSFVVDIIELILDFLGVGVVINIGIDVAVGYVFWLWYKILGVKFTKGPLISYISGFILDLIPFIDSFAWTVEVLGVYFTTKGRFVKNSVIKK